MIISISIWIGVDKSIVLQHGISVELIATDTRVNKTHVSGNTTQSVTQLDQKVQGGLTEDTKVLYPILVFIYSYKCNSSSTVR